MIRRRVRPVSPPPAGWKRIAWIGPGFLWMVSAAGSGELLFTPRIGAMYGYQLLWAMVAAVTLKWIINREIGRFAVCSGRSLLDGFSRLPGGGRWAVMVILIPQVLVAVSAVAGMAGAAATALILVLPGDVRVWMTVALLASSALVFRGEYRVIERVAMIIGVSLAGAAIVAAVSVSPSMSDLGAGLKPSFPPDVNYAEVVPWLGFMLSGAAGLIWYSYWIPAKGYGLKVTKVEGAHPRSLDAHERERLRGWVRQMTVDNSIAVVGTFVIAGAFLALGTELLRPEGLVPEEDRVAATLGRLLGDVWGPLGFWFMVTAVFVAFWDTVLSDQDGHARMFSEGIRILFPAARALGEAALRRGLVVLLLTAAPVALYLVMGEPVGLLKIAGAVEAAHIPFVAALTLLLNHHVLPRELKPSVASTAATLVAAGFFAGFAGYYTWTLLS